MLIIFTTICAIFALTYLFLRKYRRVDLKNVHCLITGGSSGIGLAFATQVLRSGGNVTIVARSVERLASAKESLDTETKDDNQKVLTFSADVSKDEDVLKHIVEEAEKKAGPINMLVNCAGTSVCQPFLETPSGDFLRMFQINYLGSVNMTRAVLPSMINQKGGTVVFVSSVAGLMGVFGYTAYSASKFALRGLAESLQMEVKPYNVSITVAFPPDTDTPGYAEEIKNKPVETMKISESAGLYPPDQVASAMLKDALNKKFLSTVGMDGYLLSTLCCGMSPIKSMLELAVQVLTMGVFRLASFYLMCQFDRIIQKCTLEKKNVIKENKSGKA